MTRRESMVDILLREIAATPGMTEEQVNSLLGEMIDAMEDGQ